MEVRCSPTVSIIGCHACEITKSTSSKVCSKFISKTVVCEEICEYLNHIILKKERFLKLFYAFVIYFKQKKLFSIILFAYNFT